MEDTDQCTDSALENIVIATNQIKQVKNDLKKTILESVSTIRNIHALKKDIVDKTAHNMKPETSSTDVPRLPSDRKVSYSDVVAGRENNRKYKITIRSKGSHTPDNMKELRRELTLRK
jgi:hypothetical protein